MARRYRLGPDCSAAPGGGFTSAPSPFNNLYDTVPAM